VRRRAPAHAPSFAGTSPEARAAPSQLKSCRDDGIVVGMATYVIDSQRRLWRTDPDAAQDLDGLSVERPPGPGGGHRETSRFGFEEVLVDPTDMELAELPADELARFGLTRERLVG
jgi:hypothetical protein